MQPDLTAAAAAYRRTEAARDFAARAAGAEERLRAELAREVADCEHQWGSWYSLSRSALAGRRLRPDEDVEDDSAGETEDDTAWVAACVHCGIARPR